MRICLFALLCLAPVAAGAEARKRARELGIEIGVLTPGPRNAINSLTMAETRAAFEAIMSTGFRSTGSPRS